MQYPGGRRMPAGALFYLHRLQYLPLQHPRSLGGLGGQPRVQVVQLGSRGLLLAPIRLNVSKITCRLFERL